MSKKEGHPWVHMTKIGMMIIPKSHVIGGEFVESEVKVSPTFSKDTIFDDLPFEDLGEGDPIAPSNIDINDYLIIEEGKWEVHFDKDPLSMTPMTKDIHMTLVFPQNSRV